MNFVEGDVHEYALPTFHVQIEYIDPIEQPITRAQIACAPTVSIYVHFRHMDETNA
jgi:hypothetical protein